MPPPPSQRGRSSPPPSFPQAPSPLQEVRVPLAPGETGELAGERPKRLRLVVIEEEAPCPIGERLSSPEDVARVAGARLKPEAEEVFLALHLDARLRLRSVQEVARGRMEEVEVDPRVVLAAPLLSGYPRLAPAHNHPSGDPEPSPEDRALTASLKAAASLLGIELVDHLVVGEGWASFKERGLYRREGWLQAF